jgi:hypothetical protein
MGPAADVIACNVRVIKAFYGGIHQYHQCYGQRDQPDRLTVTAQKSFILARHDELAATSGVTRLSTDRSYLCPRRRIIGMRSGMNISQRIIGAALVLMLAPGLALAYVGPGAGISMLGALWGLIVGVVMAVGVILFWPIRIMLRKAKANKANAEEVSAAATDDAALDSSKPADNSPAS